MPGVSAAFTSPVAAPWVLRPGAAAAVSLAAVSLLTLLLGVAFLPAEIQSARPFSSVTHSLDLGDGAAISLVWSMPSGYGGGRKFHLALRRAVLADAEFLWSELQPVSLATGPAPDHAFIGTWDGAIYRLNVAKATSEPICVQRHRGPVVALACSADGRCLVSQGAFDLRAWDLTDGCDRWRRTDVAPFCFALAPDSQTAFVVNLEGDVLEIDLLSGRSLRSMTQSNDQIIQVAISPSGNALAILGATGRLLVLDVQSGAPLWEKSIRFLAHQAPARVAAFSPSGRLLVTSDHEQGNALVVWDVATGRRLQTLRGHRRIVHGADFADGGEIRSWSADGTIRTWDLNTGAALSIVAIEPPLNAT